MMVTVHFIENNNTVLSQLLKNIPSVNDNIKIKGRKGRVLSVKQMEDTIFHVHVIFDPVVKTQPILKETKKKKR